MENILEITDMETGNKLHIPMSKFTAGMKSGKESFPKVTMITRDWLITKLSSCCVDNLIVDQNDNIIGYEMGNVEFLLDSYVSDKTYKSKEE